MNESVLRTSIVNKHLKKMSRKELSILKQYQNMVDKTNIVSMTDLNGVITYVNREFVKTSGYSKKELIGKPHNIVRDTDVPSKVFKKLWKTIQSKKVWHGVVSNVRKDGTKYTVEASIFPILDKSNNIIEYISIRHDITKLLELNKKLDEANKYKVEQETLAKCKLEAGIVNNLDKSHYQTLYKPSDVVSGDFYSIYKLKNGSIFVYLIDGQGHGVSPALTVFAISTMFNQVVYDTNSMEELLSTLYPNIRNF